MVRAILEGRKTQTRRIILHRHAFEQRFEKCTNEEVAEAKREPLYLEDGSAHRSDCIKYLIENCPYGQPGDELWVRETWALDEVFDRRKGSDANKLFTRWYRVDESKAGPSNCNDRRGRWRSSRFMPRWASRLQLVIRDVRVQRLQEISEEDALAEGVRCWVCNGPCDGTSENDCECFHAKNARTSFEVLWDSINSKRAPWSSNPFVWAITFERKV